MSGNKSIWIGLVGVRSLPDSEILKDVSGAYVNVLTWAETPEEFRSKAQELMEYLRLMLVEVENPEPLRNRGNIEELDHDVAEIARQVQGNPKAIMYGKFHTWTKSNA